MTNRRKFILQSSLAATALVASKPMNALTKISSPLIRGRYHFNNVVFLHTAGGDPGVLMQVKKITDKNTSVVLLHAGNNGDPEPQQLHYDVSHQSLNESYEGGYKNKNKANDISLAGNSENIDIIVGKYASNSPKRPVTVYNKKRAEVIIHYTPDTEMAIGKIKIGLDQFGGKFNISF